MSRVRPRQVVHRGVVPVAALLIDGALHGEGEARSRALAAWRPGVRVEACGAGWLLRLPAPTWAPVSECAGIPLIRQGGLLVSAPLEPKELSGLGAEPGSAVLVRAGEALRVEASAEEVDLSGWLAVEAWSIDPVQSLGAPPPAVQVAPARALDRESFAMAPASPELASVLAALRGEAPVRPPEVEASAPSPGGAGPGWLSRLLAALFVPRGAPPMAPRSTAPSGKAMAPTSLPSGPSWFERLKSVLAEWLMSSRLASLVGRRQAEYLARMMSMFQDGDLDAALRHAIPLGSLPGAAPTAPSLSVPTPRRDLVVQPRAALRAGSAIGLSSELFAHLQRMYRQAVTQLERAGRFDEAAFVLAELLHATAEAVSFLERHDRLRLAAELAEARNLAPELIVRQWFIAGDTARAVAVARRTGCFATAVLRLESTDRPRGSALRLVWADALAEAGDYAAAVHVVWPDPRARKLALAWLERALQAGGPVEAAMLARKAALVPEAFEGLRSRVEALCDDASLEGAPSRRALADGLAQGDATAETAALARAVLRAQIRDQAAGLTGGDVRLIGRLQALANDGPLRADMPSPTALVRGSGSRWEKRELAWGASDVGGAAICDLARLPGGRLLVALGEAGARLLTPDGRVVSHFDRPAHRLVVSDVGTKAIALAPRGEGWRLSRLDLVARTSSDWCEARLDRFASEFDGALWFAAAEGAVLALDATAPRLNALWRVGDLGGPVRTLARSPNQLLFLVGGDGGGLWHYDLPQLTLRSRAPPSFRLPPQAVELLAVWPPAVAVRASRLPAPDAVVRLDATHWSGEELSIPAVGCQRVELSLGAGGMVVSVFRPEGASLHWVGGQRQVAATFELARAQRVAVRFGPEGTLAVGDDRGRLLVYHLDQGVLLRDLRL